ncbi:hypothetical protein RclHR1_13350006 [Rhizophagus clarus]|uniref:Uncharacterized protein n=1 Tax=Rhizophagus clarus TaxID=94130 RepID=A0A2Z6Q9V0_9GLOM|nr:hypothetical protein RclHR1_13350006 [Rhizophagus clarus]GES76792.1 hypothetical protein RCL_e912_RclHR1_13350006 [Rhizophagus clarus]
MKKGFLLIKPAAKTASTSSMTQVTLTFALKSIPSDRFHNVIVDFISELIKRNLLTIFNSILTTDPSAIEEFLNTYKDQAVTMKKLSQYIHRDDCFPIITQFLATFLNLFLLNNDLQVIFLMDFKICQELEYSNKHIPDMEDLGDPIYQSDISIIIDEINEDLQELLDDSLNTTPPHNVMPIPVTPLTKSQKRSAKKKACKKRQKL